MPDNLEEKLPTLTMDELRKLLANAKTAGDQDDLADLIAGASDELIRTKPTPVSKISAELLGRIP
jgi:hypothetical protein